MSTRPRTVSIGLVFVGLNALIWLAFGLIVALDLHPGMPDLPLYKTIIAVLALACAGVFFGLLFFLLKRNRLIYYLTVGLLGVISILFIFDEFGLADLIALLINLIPLVLLIKDRAWYLAPNPASVD